jgi:hypothetical protein
LERDISHITGCTNNIQHVVGRVRYTNVASVEQRCPWGARRQWVLQEDQVQELQVDCGFHVVLNARSLTKFMLDRDEGSAVANLKDAWQPPSSAPPEARQYRKQLVQHVTALPFGVGVGASTFTERSFSK